MKMLKKITLIKASQVPLFGPIRPSGYSTEVDEVTFESLLNRGVILDEGIPTEAGDDSVPAPVVETEAEPADEPVEEPAPAKNRPSRTAGIDDWRAFAKTKGVETKNLSKQEIIAATQ